MKMLPISFPEVVSGQVKLANDVLELNPNYIKEKAIAKLHVCLCWGTGRTRAAPVSDCTAACPSLCAKMTQKNLEINQKNSSCPITW